MQNRRRTDGTLTKKHRFYRNRKKVCLICQKNLEFEIDYKNIDLLKRFINDKAKILARRFLGTCAKHQRFLKMEIKRARKIALLPFMR